MATKAELQEKCSLLEKENTSLKTMLARMERELKKELLPEEITPSDMPNKVEYWIRKFGMPWEAFWCFDHKKWIDQINSSFPYDFCGTCPQCRKVK
jgi:hypothetical protein